MKMRFEAYKYTGNKPRMFETLANAENIGLHQNKKNNGHCFLWTAFIHVRICTYAYISKRLYQRRKQNHMLKALEQTLGCFGCS